MNLRTLAKLPKGELRGKRVLLRVDFDVPIKAGRVLDDFRIRAVLPTLRYLFVSGAKILLLTKRGHFSVKKSPGLSTKALIPHLQKLTHEKIVFLKNFSELKKFSAGIAGERLFLFENLRFWKAEESDSAEFARRFAKAADIFISDNFGTAHRNHATVTELPKLLPAYAGFLLEKEIAAFEQVLAKSQRPAVAVMGGIKLETKLPLINKFLQMGNFVLVGGALANEKIARHPKLFLPQDGPKKAGRLHDVGPKTIAEFSKILRRAKIIVWNGPMGQVEIPSCTKGTIALARLIQKTRAFKVVGGGDTIAFLERRKLLNGFDHVSTGGGAMLVFLAGKKLPGIEALKKL